MKQSERRIFLIEYLKRENSQYKDIQIPDKETEQRRLLRSLINVRIPSDIGKEFLEVQDEYLKEIIKEKGITLLSDLVPVQKNIYLWKGDITTLEVDAIVNAANSGMTGCYFPNHGCIDNAIHTYSGIELRLECDALMEKQGHEKTGGAKMTDAYNLPCKKILHTVGPIIRGKLTKKDCLLLESCYKSCLELADKNNLKSIAFCCISTGEFHFPNDKAAQIAVDTVRRYKKEKHSEIEVVFNVFKEEDCEIYRELLGKDYKI